MRYCDLAATLDLRLDNEQLLSSSEVTDVQPDNEHVRLTLRQKGAVRHVSAKLLVHAEGSPADSPECWEHDYRQHAIIAELRPAQAHGNRAWERFTPDGPLALLPFGENYALVMTVPAQQAEALLQLDDPGFLATLRERCGRQLDFISTSPRRAFPLALRLRKTLVRQRQVWIGNTAQTLHPVTGQGFNLGLRDAWELAEALQNNPSSDPGDTAMLAAYARNRQPDRLLDAALTDGFVRLFSNDYLPLKIARGLGLRLGSFLDDHVSRDPVIVRLGERARSGESAVRIIFDAASEVGKPVLFGVGIIILVFMPLLSLEGMEGKDRKSVV